MWLDDFKRKLGVFLIGLSIFSLVVSALLPKPEIKCNPEKEKCVYSSYSGTGAGVTVDLNESPLQNMFRMFAGMLVLGGIVSIASSYFESPWRDD